MSRPLEALSADAKSRLRKAPQPSWTKPMLATLTDKHFSDQCWLYERKLDGERCLAFRDGGSVTLMSRNRRRLNDAYPELVEAIKEQAQESFILDGEIVAFEGSRTSFARLQGRMQVTDARRARLTGITIYYYLFDLPYLDGHDTTRLRLRDRKGLLKRAISFGDPLRFTPHRNEHGLEYHREVCEKGWEGLIAKRADSRYQHTRSRDWLKFKCVNEQELVIGGFTRPRGSRTGFGALLAGYYDNGRLMYAGKVGTGFDERTLRSLHERLSAREEQSAPFAAGDLPRHDVHWVRPELVAQIGFTEWTEDGRLRHPRYLGLRSDKDPREVVREAPRG